MTYSSQAFIDEMLALAGVTQGDIVCDLGCGDGRLVLAALARGASRGIGVDIDPSCIALARERARRAGVTERADWIEGDLFSADVSRATVVLLYTVEALNLKSKLLGELRPGTRVVSHGFGIGDWKPDAVSVVEHDTLYLWTVPADPGSAARVEDDVAAHERIRFEDLHPLGLTLRRPGEPDLRSLCVHRPAAEPACAPCSAAAARHVAFSATLENSTERSLAAVAVQWRFEGLSGRSSAVRRILAVGAPRPEFVLWHPGRPLEDVPARSSRLVWDPSALEFCASRTREKMWADRVLRLDCVVFEDGTVVGPDDMGCGVEIGRIQALVRDLAHRTVARMEAGCSPVEVANEVDRFLKLASPGETDTVGRDGSVYAAAQRRTRLAAWCARVRASGGPGDLVRSLLARSESSAPAHGEFR